MKPYTWEEISKARGEEKTLIVETYGLLGAVAVELAGALARLGTPPRHLCAVNKFLRDYPQTYQGLCPDGCPLVKKDCDYDAGKKNLIKLYAELYQKKYGKKKAKKK